MSGLARDYVTTFATKKRYSFTQSILSCESHILIDNYDDMKMPMI